MRRNGGLRWVGKKVDARLRRPRARMNGLLPRTSTFFPISVPDLTWGALIGAPRIGQVHSVGDFDAEDADRPRDQQFRHLATIRVMSSRCSCGLKRRTHS